MRSVSLFRPYRSPLLALAVGISVCLPQIGHADPSLEAGFHHPPASAQPHTWWHWLNGNVTRKGITADLEAMKHVGVGGAQIFNVDQGIPAGPVRFMSPQWLDMMKFASSEAHRLGIELAMMNCAGWSSSGGPWNTPAHAMQFLTTSERHVKGPMQFNAALAQPATRLNYYQDIAVLAFRTPAAEELTMRAAAPQITASIPDTGAVADGSPSTSLALPAPAAGSSSWVQFAFAAPFQARTLRLQTGPGRNGIGGEVRVSDDGVQFRTVQSFHLSREAGNAPGLRFNFDSVSARCWRVIFDGKVSLAEAELSPDLRIPDIAGKAAFVRSDQVGPSAGGSTSDAVVAGVLDLTARTRSDGRLVWDVPPGEWTILRCGYTPTGTTNEPGPPEGTGPESDKLSREATDAHWAGAVAPVLKALGPQAGRALNNVLIDSYEVGSENWSPRFREDFQARRGYDPVPWLPVTTGRVIESPAASEKFLWDMRRTISDLFAANYAGRFAQLAHQNGMAFSAEPYGNGTFEDFQFGGTADIPMGEFWVGDSGSSSCKLAASIGHVYGRKVIGAESFTAVPEHARWTNDPYSLKALGDIIYCSGINRFIFHRYAMQPWTDKAPGMTMGPWGIHFERTETWWNQSTAWLAYLSRCQFLLQQGRFVADVAAFCGDSGPNTLQSPAGLPTGYDYDGLNADVLQTRLSVRDGRLVLPDGMSYRVLTLPDSDAMTPATLHRLAELVRSGAVVVGPRPTHSPSLQNSPNADDEVSRLALDVWGSTNGKTITEHAFGKGRVFWGKSLPQVLASLRVKPDFQATGSASSQIHFIHRQADGADIYFVACSAQSPQEVLGTFRISGRQPEFWHPDTGRTEPCAVWRQVGDRIEVPLRFAPSGSVFVVFRTPAKGDHLVAVTRRGPEPAPPKPASFSIIRAVYGMANVKTDQVDVTAPVQELVRQGTRHITANNALAGDPAANEVKELLLQFDLNGNPQSQVIEENDSFDLPAGATVIRALYGLDPKAAPETPQSVDVTARLRSQIKNGQLHVITGNALAGGDPAFLTPKQLTVEYRVNGQRKTLTLAENQALDLPAETNEGNLSPAYEITQSKPGHVTLLANQPGRFVITHAGGRQGRIEVRTVPTPVSLTGPWQVTFPPRLGAPPQATFPRLISWPDSSDPGIKYFSGTATYRLKFSMPGGFLGQGRRYTLDLGSVKQIAEPVLNGHSLGILWMPPFRTDVTSLLHTGTNNLEVKITNLWPNRLIGDEQFPDDIKYTAGGNIAEWPQWLLNGTPRPERRRVTFSTWKHWKKGDDLLPSGLLGPVMVESAVPISIP